MDSNKWSIQLKECFIQMLHSQGTISVLENTIKKSIFSLTNLFFPHYTEVLELDLRSTSKWEKLKYP